MVGLQAQHQVQGARLLDVVGAQGAPVLQLLVRRDEALLVRGNALLEQDLGLRVLNGVAVLHVQGDGLARQGLHREPHDTAQAQHFGNMW